MGSRLEWASFCLLLLVVGSNATRPVLPPQKKTLRISCKPDEFLKTYPVFSCMKCDQFCEADACVDVNGCDKCKDGFYTSRLDSYWPKRCRLCEIKGCAECKDDVYDLQGAICVRCENGYTSTDNGKRCAEAPKTVPVIVEEEKPKKEESAVVSTDAERVPENQSKAPASKEEEKKDYEETTPKEKVTPSAVSASTEKKDHKEPSAEDKVTPSAVSASTAKKEQESSGSISETSSKDPASKEEEKKDYEEPTLKDKVTPSAVSASTEKKDHKEPSAEDKVTPSAVSASTEKKDHKEPSAEDKVTPSTVSASAEKKEPEPSPVNEVSVKQKRTPEAFAQTRVAPNTAVARASVRKVTPVDGPSTPSVVSATAVAKKEPITDLEIIETKEKPEEKPEEKTEEKLEEKTEEKLEEKTEEKLEEKTEEKLEEKLEEKTEEKLEEKTEEKYTSPAPKEEPKVEASVSEKEPEVAEKSTVCRYPDGCDKDNFFNIKSCKCEACDVNCAPDKCENDKGCTECKAGYLLLRKESSANPGTCIKCSIPYCKSCSAGALGLDPVECQECDEGYELSDDKKLCNKIAPVVVNKSLLCPLGQFYKTEGKMCVDCDASCEPGHCEDDKGCVKCKPGFYTSREDPFWPRKCLPCDIKNCAECTNDVYDHWEKTCAKCASGFKLCRGDTACDP
eukprot:g8302.t1